MDKKNRARVLTLSIDVWNRTSGSDTLSNMFSGYGPDKLANVYFKSGVPDSPVCDRYFYISENAVIKSIFRPSVPTGMEVQRSAEVRQMERETETETARYRFFSKRRLWLFQYAREILWKLGRWRSEALDAFVADFDPDVLFFPIESYIYFDRVVEYVMKKSGVPAVGILWDDNFTYKVHPHNVGFLLHRLFLRRRVRRIAAACTKLYVMTPKAQRELREEFGIDSQVLTKGALLQTAPQAEPETEGPVQIVYTGKLNLGRLQAVQLLADALEKANAQQVQYELYVYSGTALSEREKSALQKKGCRFMGSVTQDKIAQIQSRADVLLLAEALRGKHRNVARLSFSTKTVDYLAKGKCILYIGSQDNATAEYMQAHGAALMASDGDGVQSVLRQLSDEAVLGRYGQKALALAKENHDLETMQKQLYQALEEAGSRRA